MHKLHIILPDIYTCQFLLPRQLALLYIHIHNLCRDSHLEDARCHDYDDEREEIVTFVSVTTLRQSKKVYAGQMKIQIAEFLYQTHEIKRTFLAFHHP